MNASCRTLIFFLIMCKPDGPLQKVCKHMYFHSCTELWMLDQETYILSLTRDDHFLVLHLIRVFFLHFAYFIATEVTQNSKDYMVIFIREYNTGSTHLLMTVRIITKLLWCTNNFPAWRKIKCGWVSLKIFPWVSFLSMERQYPDKRHLRLPCFHVLAFISSLNAQNLPISFLPRTVLQISSVSFLL